MKGGVRVSWLVGAIDVINQYDASNLESTNTRYFYNCPMSDGHLEREPMRYSVFSAIALVAAITSTNAASGQRVHDLTPGYWKFLAEAKRSPFQVQQAWTRHYFGPNRKVLAYVQCPLLASGRLPLSGAVQGIWFESTMRQATIALRKTLPQALRRLRTRFPDNTWRGDIYIMSSLGCFAGRAQSVNGRQAMLLGIDVIASTGNTNPTVLLTHELFHLYHQQFFKPTADPLWAKLWSEGLATYASETLNPGATLKALALPDDMVKAVDRDRARLVADLASHLNERDSRAVTLYFRTDRRTEPVPPKAGYYLGLLVVRLLVSQGHNVTEMAHWNAAMAETQVRQSLLTLRTKN